MYCSQLKRPLSSAPEPAAEEEAEDILEDAEAASGKSDVPEKRHKGKAVWLATQKKQGKLAQASIFVYLNRHISLWICTYIIIYC